MPSFLCTPPVFGLLAICLCLKVRQGLNDGVLRYYSLFSFCPHPLLLFLYPRLHSIRTLLAGKITVKIRRNMWVNVSVGILEYRLFSIHTTMTVGQSKLVLPRKRILHYRIGSVSFKEKLFYLFSHPVHRKTIQQRVYDRIAKPQELSP